MFERYLTAVFTAALVGSTGCASHGTGPKQPVQRPLWKDIPAYQAPLKPDTHEPPPADIDEPTGELQLRDALALSLLRNPRLADAAWDVRISEARTVQAGLRPNPELEIEVEEFGGAGPRKEFSGAETTIRLSQIIELGGKRGARKQAAGAGRILADYDYEAERLAVLTDATIGFIDVLVAQDQFELAGELYKLSQETFEVVAERVKAGKVSPLEETKASIELVNRKLARIHAESDLSVARRRLAATWSGKQPQFEQAAGSLGRVEDLPPFGALQDLLDRNPDVARWAAEMEKRLAELAKERAERMFDITLSAGIKRFEESDDYAFTMAVGMPLPLFDRNQGGVREAHYRLKQTERRAEDARIRTATALLEWYETLSVARTEALALQNEVVPSSRRAFEAARDGYQQGKFGYLEVLDAERTFAETNVRLLDTLGRYHRAMAVVESLIGTRIDAAVGERSAKMEER